MFGTERYESMTYQRFIERIVNAKGRWEGIEAPLNDDTFIDKIKEEILLSGDGSFSYDW